MHLESVARQTGKRPAALDGPPCPPELDYLWRWFWELHGGRTLSPMGPSRATWLDLLAWQELTGRRLRPWELRLVMALGAAWIAAAGEKTASIPPPPGAGTLRQ